MDSEEPTKPLLPYIRLADAVSMFEPRIACYCREYAMLKLMEIPETAYNDTTHEVLSSLFKQIRKDRESLNLTPHDNSYLKEFALQLFEQADIRYKNEIVDFFTAKAFYDANLLFNILDQLRELDPDLKVKHKYAIDRAADIKAINDAIERVPCPASSEQNVFSPTTTTPNGANVHNGDTQHLEYERVETDNNVEEQKIDADYMRANLKRADTSFPSPSSANAFKGAGYEERKTDSSDSDNTDAAFNGRSQSVDDMKNSTLQDSTVCVELATRNFKANETDDADASTGPQNDPDVLMDSPVKVSTDCKEHITQSDDDYNVEEEKIDDDYMRANFMRPDSSFPSPSSANVVKGAGYEERKTDSSDSDNTDAAFNGRSQSMDDMKNLTLQDSTVCVELATRNFKANETDDADASAGPQNDPDVLMDSPVKISTDFKEHITQSDDDYNVEEEKIDDDYMRANFKRADPSFPSPSSANVVKQGAGYEELKTDAAFNGRSQSVDDMKNSTQRDSTVCVELATRNFKANETDDADFSAWRQNDLDVLMDSAVKNSTDYKEHITQNDDHNDLQDDLMDSTVEDSTTCKEPETQDGNDISSDADSSKLSQSVENELATQGDLKILAVQDLTDDNELNALNGGDLDAAYSCLLHDNQVLTNSAVQHPTAFNEPESQSGDGNADSDELYTLVQDDLTKSAGQDVTDYNDLEDFSEVSLQDEDLKDNVV